MISLGFLIFAVLFVLAVALGGWDKLLIFWDVPSFLCLTMGIAAYSLFFGRKEINRVGYIFLFVPVVIACFIPLFIFSINLTLYGRLLWCLGIVYILSCWVFIFLPFYFRKEFRTGWKTFFAFSFPTDEESIKAGQFFLRLSSFTMRWGLVIALFGLILMMSDLNPDRIGAGVAVCLLSIMYSSALAVFVFLPIALRLTPEDFPSPDHTVRTFWRFSIYHLLIAFVLFFLVRFVLAIILLSIQLGTSASSIHSDQFVKVLYQAAFTFNPADPQTSFSYYSPFAGLDRLRMYWDLPSLVLVVGCWWAFRLASGKRRRWIAAPVIIVIGIQGTILGCCLMLADLDLDKVGAGFQVATITTLYAFIGATGFLLADMRKSKREPPTVSPPPDADAVAGSQDIEQAKKIIDNVVENERRL